MSRKRARITIQGEVQGVGFRPFVYRLARQMGLGGWVRNEGAGLVIEAEGEQVDRFVSRLGSEHPHGARIESLQRCAMAPVGEMDLRIVESQHAPTRPRIVPDRVTCDDCVADVFDAASRYFGYPFTNCSACGPRYSIVDAVPYDRANTAMAAFSLCAACAGEYADPANRRFHAQPTACPACGPQLALRGPGGDGLTKGAAALPAAAALLTDGAILALKGLGGYQLMADAYNTQTVARLRERKHRPHKPFAVMVPDLCTARDLGEMGSEEARLLRSPAGPIVLLRSRNSALAATLHPCHGEIGVLLPTTALHHLLLRHTSGVLVCTSGNLGDEPICIDDEDALERLGGIADAFLVHDRPIRRAVDDSLARVIDGAPQVLRLARGYAPLVLPLPAMTRALAMGAQQKNALAVASDGYAVMGPHVGNLTSTRSVEAMRAQATALPAFFAATPGGIVRDLHPEYASSTFAMEQGLPVSAVQHHLAHALAVMVEHGLSGPVLAVVWDGNGLGCDGSIWGGEFLRVERKHGQVNWQRVAHLRRFRLPGADAAARDPQRALAGLLWELPEQRQRVTPAFGTLLNRELNSPWCSSMGRLFDGVGAALGHGATQTYEGMTASLVERDAQDHGLADGIGALLSPITVAAGEPGQAAILDWAPMLRSLLDAMARGESKHALCAAFHAVLARAVGDVTRAQRLSSVLLTGGCFQNRVLTKGCCRELGALGVRSVIPRQLPPNDGAIAFGQLAALGAANEEVGSHVPRHPRTY